MKNNKVNYVEFAACELKKSTQFFSQAFGWQFHFFGPEYVSFSAANAGLDGGFYKADLASETRSGGALVVLFSDNLEETEQSVIKAGGVIVKPIFTFPGGRRFHFKEPSGNELAVWSDR